MWLIDQIAERKISEALERGELDDLPGAGRPIGQDAGLMVPEELRVAYRLLKNAGYLPPDVQLRRDIESAEVLLIQAASQEECSSLNKRLAYLRMKLSISGYRSCRTPSPPSSRIL
jgi:hypothetical protein